MIVLVFGTIIYLGMAMGLAVSLSDDIDGGVIFVGMIWPVVIVAKFAAMFFDWMEEL